MSTMFEEKVYQFEPKVGDMTNVIFINAIAHLLCINDCGSTSCSAIKMEPTGASQTGLKIKIITNAVVSGKEKLSFENNFYFFL